MFSRQSTVLIYSTTKVDFNNFLLGLGLHKTYKYNFVPVAQMYSFQIDRIGLT